MPIINGFMVILLLSNSSPKAQTSPSQFSAPSVTKIIEFFALGSLGKSLRQENIEKAIGVCPCGVTSFNLDTIFMLLYFLNGTSNLVSSQFSSTLGD